MWQETRGGSMPEPSTVFGVGAIYYAGLAFVAAVTIASATSLGDAVSVFILGVVFLAVAGVSARLAFRSSEWPSTVQMPRIEPRRLRIAGDEADEEDAKAA